MSIRLQLRFRAVMSALTGLVLLLEAVHAVFFRSGFDAFATMVNVFIALFGVAFLLQCWRLVRQLRKAQADVLIEEFQEVRSK
jgi:hypothetical protein